MTNSWFRLEKFLFWASTALVVYMPLHIFLSQSLSLLTGGLEVWKAAKDVVVVGLVPLLLAVAWKKQLHTRKSFRLLVIAAGGYVALHLAYVLFDSDDHTRSAIVASVYNLRPFAYLLFGYVVATSMHAARWRKMLLTATVLIASLVATFGVAQYFLPPDLLENVGYSLERGVKPLFFIDDRPELPRVMSTLRDPNSLGSYLVVPTLLVAWALASRRINENLFVRPFRRGVLGGMLALLLLAQLFTFSRGAFLALLLGSVTLLSIVTGERVVRFVRKYWYVPIVLVLAITLSIISLRNSEFVQDYIFHAAVSTDDADPNEKRVQLQTEAIADIIDQPQGYGPGTAGLVSISNPQGGLLTENYFLQIGYEVGLLGLGLFLLVYGVIHAGLWLTRKDPLSAVLFAAGVGYVFYSLLIHLWANEAVALQWWLLAGVALAPALRKPPKK